MTESVFAVGDAITVTGHYRWGGLDTHGRTGRVLAVTHYADHPTLYGCEVVGFRTVVPLQADEMAATP